MRNNFHPHDAAFRGEAAPRPCFLVAYAHLIAGLETKKWRMKKAPLTNYAKIGYTSSVGPSVTTARTSPVTLLSGFPAG